MPIAVEPERATFTYIDPGMGTRSELDSWGGAHRDLWHKLRQAGRRVEVVAVAWEQHVLDRAGRVLSSWRGRGVTEAELELITLREALSRADWETVDHHGGFDIAVDRMIELDQQIASNNDGGIIDDFRLWGSRRCHRMGVALSEGGGDIEG